MHLIHQPQKDLHQDYDLETRKRQREQIHVDERLKLRHIKLDSVANKDFCSGLLTHKVLEQERYTTIRESHASRHP